MCLRTGIVAALVLIGLGLLLPTATAASAPAGNCAAPGSIDPANRMSALPPDEAEAAIGAANTDGAVRTSIDYLRERGFAAVDEHVAFREATGAQVVHLVYGSAADPERSAATVTQRTGPSGQRSTELTMVGLDATGRPVAVASTPVRPNQPPDLRHRRQGYTGCMVFCLSAQCGANASKCNGIPHLGAKLACMLVVCGAQAPGCDRMCRALR